jgi:hypothetical protein
MPEYTDIISDTTMWQGHQFSPASSDSSTRLSFTNIHGLCTKGTTLNDATNNLLAVHQMYSIDVGGISEHHLPMKAPKLSQRLYNSMRSGTGGTHTTFQFDSSQELPSTGVRLMGGTGIMALGNVTGRMEPKGKSGDPMGRWSSMTFRRKRQPPLTIISVYQVCPTPTNAIGHTAWHQQRRALDLAHRPTHPRKAFIEDLDKTIQQFLLLRHDLIIGGDWNECDHHTHSGILRLCTSHDLVDPWHEHYPNRSDNATYEFGIHRIDSVVMSRATAQKVKHIGYSPVGLFGHSDHRSLLIEFDTVALFGEDLEALPNQLSRGVRSNDRAAVTSFIETMHSHLFSNNVFARAAYLESEECSLSIADRCNLVENLDALIGEAGDIGDKKCRRRRPQWYSIDIVRQRLEVACLTHYQRGLACGKNRTQVTLLKLCAIDKEQELPTLITEVNELIMIKKQALHSALVQSGKARQIMQINRIDALDSRKAHDRASLITRIKKQESAANIWKTISHFSKASSHQTLNRLSIPANWPPRDTPVETISDLQDPKTATEWKTITDPFEIEHYLMLRNRMHFGQAQGTPFTVPPLSDRLDWTASTPTAEAILLESFIPPPDVSVICAHVLTACRATAALDQQPAELTLDAFSGKMKKWRETTTTSPSGRHLGRYKALFAESTYIPRDSEDDEPGDCEIFQRKQADIAHVIVQLINFCIRHGHVLNRWKQIVNTMIFKDEGVYKIHRLRIIHIYEADFNLLLAVKWRDLVSTADQAGLINKGQYGGRPGHEAASLALLEELRIDLTYLTRRTLITFDNDAASCYDRIIPAFASLINRKYGLNRQVAVVHGRTLQEARYKLRTAVGISESEYSHSTQFPLYGSGQGSGNSPALWLFISATLFDVHDTFARGATFQDPTGSTTVHLKLSGFVDDTNATLNDWKPQDQMDLTSMLALLAHDAQLWNDLLFVSGGKLELSKCSFHVLQFKFKPDGEPTPELQEPPPITLRDSESSNHITINGLRADQPHKTLGHWKAPAGKPIKQLQAIKQKAIHTSLLIVTAPLPRHGVRLAYFAKYVASLRYVLPQCYFTHAELRKAQTKSTPALIAKCGFTRKTAYALLFAPKEMAGGGFLHWSTIQSEGQIKHFLKHWRTSTDISTILRIVLAWTQWQAGSSTPLLADPSIPFEEYVEGRWIHSLREALRASRTTIRVDQSFVQPLERDRDQHLMDIARRSKQYSPQAMRQLNYCRLFLHVTTVSELYDQTGTKLLPHIERCERPPWFDPTTITVLQLRPTSRKCLQQWRSFCQHIQRIVPSVGAWLPRIQSLRLRRETYWIPGDNPLVYHWYVGQYWECQLTEAARGQYTLLHPTDWKPTLLDIPIQCTARIRLKGYMQIPLAPAQPQPSPACPSDFETYIQICTQPWERALLSHIQWIIPPFQAIEYIHQMSATDDSLLLVSDGSSFESKSMSFGLAIGSAYTGRTLVENLGPSFGRPSSHRAECTGCLSGALLLYHLQQFTQITRTISVPVVAISDNQGMIHSLQDRATYKTVYPNATLQPDWDLLEEIHATYSKTNIQSLTYRWVRGHQDEQIRAGNTSTSTAPPTKLTPEAKLNIQADALAGEYHILIDTKSRPRTPLMTTTRCILQQQGASLHANYSTVIRRAVAEPAYMDYMERKHHWGPRDHKEVMWEPFYMAARTYHSTEVHLLKLVHDQLPTRSHLARFQPWTNPQCHHCIEIDTIDHLQRGQCNPVSLQYPQAVTDALTLYFEKHRTPIAFQSTFLFSLQQWLTDETQLIVNAPQWNASTVLYYHQEKLGWRLMFRGFLSRHWLVYLHQCIHNDRWRTTRPTTNEFDPDLIGGRLSDPVNERTQESTQQASNPTPHPLNCYTQAKRMPAVLPEPDLSTPPQTIDPTIFFAGLIKTLWEELSKLWRSHLDLIHETATSTSSPVSRSEVCIRIRSLVAKEPMVLPIHRTSRYFPPNLDDFLNKSSLPQLQNYLAQYSPVIHSSIAQQHKALEMALTPSAGGPHSTPNPIPEEGSIPPGTAAIRDAMAAPALDDRSAAQSPSQQDYIQPIDIQSDTESDDDLLPQSSTGHPALEEATHRKSRGHRIRQSGGTHSQS